MLPATNQIWENKVLLKLHSVQGNNCCCVLLLIKKSNRKGITTWATSTTPNIPIIEIVAMDLNAGSFANISSDSPVMVVIADSTMEDLNEDWYFLPVLYSCNK